MYTKKIYFSGGSFYELQEVFSRVKGAIKATAGYINGEAPGLDYEAVVSGKTEAVFGVEVEYDPKKIDLSSLMDILFAVVNPYLRDRQGVCEGRMYRSGVYYVSDDDGPTVEYYMNFLRNRRKIPAATEAQLTINDPNSDPNGARQCYAEAGRLKIFEPAAQSEQNYLSTHPEQKTNIDFPLLQRLGIIR